MAVIALTTARVEVGNAWTGTAPGNPGTQTVSGTITTGTDLSAWAKGLSMPQHREVQNASNFGSNAFDNYVPGMRNMTATFTLLQDYAAGGPYATLNTLFANQSSAAPVFWDIRPTTAARSATNPSFVVAGYIVDFPFMEASVGEVSELTVPFQVTGVWAALTS